MHIAEVLIILLFVITIVFSMPYAIFVRSHFLSVIRCVQNAEGYDAILGPFAQKTVCGS